MSASRDEEEKIFCRVILLGESETKKNGIIKRFVSGNFSFNNVTSTLGSNFASKKLFFKEENKSIKYEIWDTAGQEKYRSMARVFYKNTDVFILVYDITNYKSFDELKNYWIKDVKEYANKDFSKKK